MFSVQLLLIDIKHDSVLNCGEATSYWLVVVFNAVKKSFKKNYTKSGKLNIDL